MRIRFFFSPLPSRQKNESGCKCARTPYLWNVKREKYCNHSRYLEQLISQVVIIFGSLLILFYFCPASPALPFTPFLVSHFEQRDGWQWHVGPSGTLPGLDKCLVVWLCWFTLIIHIFNWPKNNVWNPCSTPDALVVLGSCCVHTVFPCRSRNSLYVSTSWAWWKPPNLRMKHHSNGLKGRENLVHGEFHQNLKS